ncbi:TniQ family protein [Herbaspirillum sp. WKF16]|uniref:TniQ family protein n=1 Tax=Herbaspirillum sp. WKF16 TaxID=3028312 RepID=UPI0023A94300|nr:TniQ family protein [Herbaspirillum sp. WKF16]WDZ95756.1 TniQ family protein [Herbaspirillum sp. WKF16]
MAQIDRNAALVVARISPEEHISGYLAVQGLRRNTFERLLMPKSVSNETNKPAWVFPTGIQSIANEYADVLPDAEALLMKHTLFPYFSPFLDEVDTDVLRRHHLDEAQRGIASTTGSHMFRGKMAVCIDCIGEDLSHESGPGYATWKRLHHIPRMLMCPQHGQPLMTFCESCQDGHRRLKSHWLPSTSCLCGGSLKVIANVAANDEASEMVLAGMAEAALLGKIPEHLSPTQISDLTHAALSSFSSSEEIIVARLEDALLSAFGPSVLESLHIRKTTMKRLAGVPRFRNLGPVRTPIHVMAVVHAVFGGFEQIMNMAKSTSSYSKSIAQLSTPESKGINSSSKWQLQKLTYAERLNSLSKRKRQAITMQHRSWIKQKKRENPSFKRTDIPLFEGGYAVQLHMSAIDSAWFESTLPPQMLSARQRKNESAIQLRISHLETYIKNRYELAISTKPFSRISERYLLNGFPSESSKSMAHKSVAIVSLLNTLKDTNETFRMRVTPLICSHVRTVSPGHHFGVEESFTKLNTHRNFVKRLWKAKQWLNTQNL